MISFELHTQKINQKWQMESVFDDREIALHEARLADESDRYISLQLVEEFHDEATGKTAQKIIFRGGKNKKDALARISENGGQTGRTSNVPKSEREFSRSGRRSQTAAKPKAASPVMMLVLLLVFGMAALYALYEFSPD